MIDRREAVRVLGSGIVGTLLAKAGALEALAAQTSSLLSLPLPVLDDPQHPSFEVFHRLGQWVTVKADLDPAASRTLYPVFLAEPWGPKHISTAFSQIATALGSDDTGRSVPELIRDGRLGEGETWFVSHLLTTWYLGVYYHETRMERVLYAEALMFGVVADTHPVIALSDREYGFWTERPADMAR